ncbi:MAG: porphobilinogen synthase [Candidatus Palauibacterales bacterium]|nr:porphobilinogen synthase [Candidatus Palauibacterales bacterium]
MSGFPARRMRRLRRTGGLRSMVRETHLRPEDLILPLFADATTDTPVDVPSMPGVRRHPVSGLPSVAEAAVDDGVRAVILFGVPEAKDERGSRADAGDGVVQRAVRSLKEEFPELTVITDVCLCEYTSHGQCGIWEDGDVDNDATLERLASTAVSHAEAGADVVAPSDMMDGRVAAVRRALDDAGREETAILSYAAKYASSFYGPFRDAADSAPDVGHRRGYQMDPANAREALREVRLDVEEGADVVMVKPAMPYLDVLSSVRREFDLPTAAYHVSGEYAMIRAAGEKGWLDDAEAMHEAVLSIKRAGADLVVTYAARELARRARSG